VPLPSCIAPPLKPGRTTTRGRRITRPAYARQVEIPTEAGLQGDHNAAIRYPLEAADARDERSGWPIGVILSECQGSGRVHISWTGLGGPATPLAPFDFSG